MPITTEFKVFNDLTINTTNHILVFLKPVKALSNYQYLAWQDLNPAPGGFQKFDYEIDLGVQVSDATSGNPPGPNSMVYPINPGELFSATNPNEQGPILDTININQGDISSAQAGVVNNCTTPITSLALSWTNKGIPIVNVGVKGNDVVNLKKTVTFELEPSLYFMAADPTIQGDNFTVQDFSNMTQYKLEAGTTNVEVHWSRGDGGLGVDQFQFSK